jgi:hypothetical protein
MGDCVEADAYRGESALACMMFDSSSRAAAAAAAAASDAGGGGISSVGSGNGTRGGVSMIAFVRVAIGA